MYLVKRKLILLIALLFIYSAYFAFHSYTVSSPQTLGVQANLALFQQPEDGKKTILSLLNSARQKIDMKMYLLSDKDVVNSLLDACQRGVVVRVMIEQHPFGGGNSNGKTASQLQPTCVHFQWTNPSFALTHEKTVVIDSTVALILTQNLTEAAFSKNREYNIVDTNKKDVEEIEKIFNADWERSAYWQKESSLIISPISSRAILVSLISNTTKQINIEMEVMNDQMIIHLLSEKAKSSIVRVVLASFTKISSNRRVAAKLSREGVKVRILEFPYLHAKLMLFDDTKAYLGSINLTTQSLDENREVGILISQQNIIEKLREDFLSDWENAQPFSE